MARSRFVMLRKFDQMELPTEYTEHAELKPNTFCVFSVFRG